jgi:hypothetical protein
LQVELRTSLKGYRRDEKGLHRYVHGATVASEDAKQIATEAGLEGFLLSWMNQGDGNMHAYRWSEELGRFLTWRDGYKTRHYVYTYMLENKYDPPTDEELPRFSS